MASKKISDFFVKRSKSADSVCDASCSAEPYENENTKEREDKIPENCNSEVYSASSPLPKRKKRDWQKYRSGVSDITFGKWKKEFPWLMKETNQDGEETMYCSVCRQFSSKVLPGPGVSSSFSTVFSIGCKVFKHENVQRHDNSQVHIMSVNISKAKTKPEDTPLLKATLCMNEQVEEKMKKLFNTAYHVAKQDTSFVSFPSLIALQKKNGVNLGGTYNNHHACSLFLQYIAKDIRNQILKEIIDCDYFSLLSDGSTDVSMTECEIVYILFVRNGQKKIVFLKLIELSSGTAEAIFSSIIDYLDSVGVDYKNKLIGVCFDGASVNFGEFKGVARRFGDICKGIVKMHCVAHRLELTINDVMKKESTGLVKECDVILKGLYKTYNKSPKMLKQLKDLAELYEKDLLKHTGIIQTRWISARQRSITAFCNNYEVTVSHLENYCETVSDSDNSIAKMKGYLQTMKRYDFVEFMFFMQDLTKLLSDLSLSMQYDKISVKQIMDKIDTCKSKLKYLKTNDKANLKKFYAAYDKENNSFKGIQLTESTSQRKNKSISDGKGKNYRNEIIDSILFNFNERFESLFENPVFKNLDVFEPLAMPEDKKDLLSYGIAEFDEILENVPECVMKNINKEKAKDEYDNFKLWAKNKRTVPFETLLARFFAECQQSSENLNLCAILSFLEAVVTSTSICERGFSAMKLIKSDKRNKLQVSTVNDLLTVNLNGPMIEAFDPSQAINLWWEDTTRIRRPNIKD